MTRPTPPYVRNVCLARGSQPANTNTSIYTVPSNFVVLLKSVFLYNPGAAPSQVSTTLTDAPSSIGIPIISEAIPAAGTFAWESWVALNAGDHVYVGTTGIACSYWLSGAVLPYAV